MTAMLKTLRQAEFPNFTVSAGIQTIKGTLLNLWPPAAIVVALAITLVWAGGWAWLAISGLLALI